MNLFWNLRSILITLKPFSVMEKVACYMRNYLSYNIISVFPQEIENFFFESVPPNSKPVVVRTFYCPPEKLFRSFKNSRLQ